MCGAMRLRTGATRQRDGAGFVREFKSPRKSAVKILSHSLFPKFPSSTTSTQRNAAQERVE
jgi:hypothetical protein